MFRVRRVGLGANFRRGVSLVVLRGVLLRARGRFVTKKE